MQWSTVRNKFEKCVTLHYTGLTFPLIGRKNTINSLEKKKKNNNMEELFFKSQFCIMDSQVVKRLSKSLVGHLSFSA